MILRKNLEHTLFLDIETVSLQRVYEDLTPRMQGLWKRKCRQFLFDKTLEVDDELAASFYTSKAGIYAEFAKVVCISIGYLTMERGQPPQLRIKSFSGDEAEVLQAFADVLDEHYDDPDQHFLCGHNIREFDLPFLCRRSVVHRIRLPRLMDVAGKKPWQISYLIDTMTYWKFGDFKNFTSLALLAETLSIPTPKDDIDGSQVGSVYWEDGNLERIVTYCEKDVVTVVKIILHIAHQADLAEEHIIHVQA